MRLYFTVVAIFVVILFAIYTSVAPELADKITAITDALEVSKNCDMP